MKKLLCVLPALLLAFIPSSANAKAGHLDRTFGSRGTVVTLVGSAPKDVNVPSTSLAWAPGRKIVAEVGNKLLEYLPDGHLNRGFGVRGKVRIEAPPGMALEVVDVKVDSRGRILVAGTASPPESALVSRFLPDGRPDQSFGSGGTVITDLGFTPPPPPANTALNPTPPITEPLVKVSGLAIDAADRPLLTGSWVSSFRNCYPSLGETPISTGYVARLSVSGAIDPSFGEGGVAAPDPSKELWFSPQMDGKGLVSVGSLVNCLRGSPPDLELVRLAENGGLDPWFGSDGRIALPPSYELIGLTRDRYGRLLLIFDLPDGETLLRRLRRNGFPDKHFGNGRDVRLPTEYSRWNGALGSDRRGRPIFASREGWPELKSWWLIVGRRRSDGAVDRSFGKRGEVTIRFPGQIDPQQVLVGGDKFLVGGTVVSEGKYAVGLARYLDR